MRMHKQELMTVTEIAQRLGYSVHYFQNNWPVLLKGIRPLQLRANGKKLFAWQDVEALLRQPK